MKKRKISRRCSLFGVNFCWHSQGHTLVASLALSMTLATESRWGRFLARWAIYGLPCLFCNARTPLHFITKIVKLDTEKKKRVRPNAHHCLRNYPRHTLATVPTGHGPYFCRTEQNPHAKLKQRLRKPNRLRLLFAKLFHVGGIVPLSLDGSAVRNYRTIWHPIGWRDRFNVSIFATSSSPSSCTPMYWITRRIG